MLAQSYPELWPRMDRTKDSKLSSGYIQRALGGSVCQMTQPCFFLTLPIKGCMGSMSPSLQSGLLDQMEYGR